MSEWRPDILGDGFEYLDLDLGEDEEGPLVATLVRALPEPRSLWDRLLRRTRPLESVDVLYVHGWSDYFFQRRLARFFTERGARFFALDLRKYGRSLRDGQTPGYIEDLAAYDAEIEQALQVMGHPVDRVVEHETAGAPHDGAETGEEAETGDGVDTPQTHDGGETDEDPAASPRPTRRLLLLGHSTGGLVLSLWSDRHRGVADGLVLNSPWLELQLSGAVRRALHPMVSLQARLNPRDLALPQLDHGLYSRAQRLAADPAEPDTIDLRWRPERSHHVRAGWLRAILAGHALIAARVDVGAPVCVLLSGRSYFSISWNEAMSSSDTVLDVDEIAGAALKLGPSVTVERIDGALHDVFLSERTARAQAYARLDRWLRGWVSTLD